MEILEVIAGTNATTKLQCDMKDSCTSPITHIGEKGYVYCAEHKDDRKGIERCRKLRKWELKLLESGQLVPGPELQTHPQARAASARRVHLIRFHLTTNGTTR